MALFPFVISSLWGHHSSNIDVFTIGSMMVRAAALFLLLLCPHLEAHVKHGKILLLPKGTVDSQGPPHWTDSLCVGTYNLNRDPSSKYCMLTCK